ncbi:MAG: lysophospholipase [Spirochaetales bacterium]|nr:lysophospholipase [Leptospiraceae bacterium]MCP5480585.1 lysophospholipase [Spirochaetales bacterium]MCP5483935.1 lysophospholipase [Spirochaetales bacterium]
MSGLPESGHFTGHDGTRLFFRVWAGAPEEPSRALVLHHGLGEHSGRYGNVVEALRDERVNIYTYDARGHGRSDGIRGDARGISDFVRDLECFLLFLRREAGIRQPILLGHSLGGLVVLAFGVSYSNQWEVRAIATSGAGLRPHLNAEQKVKKAVGQLLFRVKPQLVLPSGLPPSFLSHDQGVIKAYQNDHLCHDRISVRMALSLLSAGEETLRKASLLKIPVLITHGTDDQITDASASREFYDNCLSDDRELILYPGLYHEIYNETEKERSRVLMDLRRWLRNQLPVVKPAAASVNSATEHATT